MAMTRREAVGLIAVSTTSLLGKNTSPLYAQDTRKAGLQDDVHEHFRVMTEQFVPNAFVLERADGTLRNWNCQITREDDRILVTPAEAVVSRVHLNLHRAARVEVAFSTGLLKASVSSGMSWIGPGVEHPIAPDLYL